MTRCAVITGSAGGIGSAMVSKFLECDFNVIGVDKFGSSSANFSFVHCDLNLFCIDSNYRESIFKEIDDAIGAQQLTVLINNAALQIVGAVGAISADDWFKVMNVNVNAPFLMAQHYIPILESSQGSIVNISSIHANLTKAGFSAYATSKGALSTLTRALAVECGSKVRVNAISPAAIETSMLRDGFIDAPHKLVELQAFHPVGRIGSVDQVADLAFFLTQPNNKFINGAIFDIDGGISSKLHDPA